MLTTTGAKVQRFYNRTPFPDFDLKRFPTREALRAVSYPFSRALDASIPLDATVIDIGTGTGQLAALLALSRKNVWGIDFSDSSLKKARDLKEKLQLNTLILRKVDILNTKEIDDIGEKFDYVLCLGVLHHTGDAHVGFQNIVRLLKPGGFIAVGLYNSYGRLFHKMRMFLARTVFKNNDAVKDRFIKMQIGSIEDKERARGWWNDQYLHPHESTHTVGEVLRWFREENIEYVTTLPPLTPFDYMHVDITGLWNSTFEKKPSRFRRFRKQFLWVFTTHHDGGYWVTFGRRKV